MKKTDSRYYLIDGTKLKNKRRKTGLTQAELAERLDMDVSTLQKNEREGPHNMFIANVTAIATMLKCNPEDLLYDSVDPPDTSTEQVRKTDAQASPQAGDEASDIFIYEAQTLVLSPYADEALKMAVTGLIRASGGKNRVSMSIASISGYMRSIVWRTPGLKNHMLGLIEAIIPALGSSQLDDESAILALRTGLRNNMAELRDVEELPAHAKKEGELIVALLVRSQMANNDGEQLRAVKASMYWLRNYWQYVCQKQTAYYAWSDICCMLSGAPTDYFTRASIMTKVNEFALYVSLLDPIYEMIHN